jgi:nucleotide-binding universal stress UspA family protein
LAASTLTLVHTCELPIYTYPGMAMSGTDLLTTLEEAARRQLEPELERVRESFPAAKAILRTGTAWEQILATIDAIQADLVVTGRTVVAASPTCSSAASPRRLSARRAFQS